VSKRYSASEADWVDLSLAKIASEQKFVEPLLRNGPEEGAGSRMLPQGVRTEFFHRDSGWPLRPMRSFAYRTRPHIDGSASLFVQLGRWRRETSSLRRRRARLGRDSHEGRNIGEAQVARPTEIW